MLFLLMLSFDVFVPRSTHPLLFLDKRLVHIFLNVNSMLLLNENNKCLIRYSYELQKSYMKWLWAPFGFASHQQGLNMVFVKMSHGTQKCHKCHYLEYKEGLLGLVFGGSFCQPHLVDVFTKCQQHVQMIMRKEVYLYHESQVLHCYFNTLDSNQNIIFMI